MDGDFPDELRQVFKETRDLIEYICEKDGIDLSQADDAETDAAMRAMDEANDKAQAHPVSKAAVEYFSLVEDFLKTAGEWLDEMTDALQQQLELGIDRMDLMQKAAQLNDAVEVVAWYRLQIGTKLIRAFSGVIEGEEFADENGFPRDSDGSAKVALIGIDRSLDAWATLARLAPDRTDDFLSFLRLLEKLRNNAEAAFPNARAFVRPGFDERQET